MLMGGNPCRIDQHISLAMLGPEFPGMPVLPEAISELSVGGQPVTLMPGL